MSHSVLGLICASSFHTCRPSFGLHPGGRPLGSGGLQAALQSVHEINDLCRFPLLNRGDLLAFHLGPNDFQQSLAVLVDQEILGELFGKIVDDLPCQIQLLFLELYRRKVHHVGYVLELALVKKNVKHQAALCRGHRRDVLLTPHDEARQGNSIHLLHGL